MKEYLAAILNDVPTHAALPTVQHADRVVFLIIIDPGLMAASINSATQVTMAEWLRRLLVKFKLQSSIPTSVDARIIE